MSDDNVVHVFEPSMAEQYPRPDGPECSCEGDFRLGIPCDWGFRCSDCNLPIPSDWLKGGAR